MTQSSSQVAGWGCCWGGDGKSTPNREQKVVIQEVPMTREGQAALLLAGHRWLVAPGDSLPKSWVCGMCQGQFQPTLQKKHRDLARVTHLPELRDSL